MCACVCEGDLNPLLEGEVRQVNFTAMSLLAHYHCCLIQGSTITIKSPYVITYVCQNFVVSDARGQIPKNVYQVSNFSPSDFPNNFS